MFVLHRVNSKTLSWCWASTKREYRITSMLRQSNAYWNAVFHIFRCSTIAISDLPNVMMCTTYANCNMKCRINYFVLTYISVTLNVFKYLFPKVHTGGLLMVINASSICVSIKKIQTWFVTCWISLSKEIFVRKLISVSDAISYDLDRFLHENIRVSFHCRVAVHYKYNGM